MGLMPKGFRVKLLVLAALIVVVCSVGHVFAELVEGESFPVISLVNVDAEQEMEVAKFLADSVGAVVYMQTSCAVCRRELKVLQELAAKLTFKVVAISVDASGPDRVVKYKNHFGFDFPFLHDPEFKTPGLFGFAYTPALVLVGKDGKIAQLKGGFRPGDETMLEQKISELIGK